MTEEDALEKWCPFARVVEPAHEFSDKSGCKGMVVINRDSPSTLTYDDTEERNPNCFCHCIASGCMAWRWHETHIGPERHGYCGLAGKP